MRTSSAIACAAALGVAALLSAPSANAQTVVNNLCDPNYDCSWSHITSTGNVFDFDFNKLCSGFGYSVPAGNGNGTIFFNVCGRSAKYCAPKGWKSRYMYGSAILMWGAPPPCNIHDPNESFFDPALNKTKCYSADCEVLGVGTPMWSLNVATAPATGGILLDHMGVGRLANDPNKCNKDAATGDEAKSTVTILMNCDKTMTRNELSILAAYKRSECSWVIEMSSGAACGCQPNCPKGAFCGDDGCGGFCSGPALSGRCPAGQICQADKTCCKPDCNSRDCGNDGCGGSCGTCGADETCSSAQVCIATAPFIPQAPVVYAADSKGLAGSFFGGMFASVACAGAVWFLRFGGRAKFDAWRHGSNSNGGSDAAGEGDSRGLLGSDGNKKSSSSSSGNSEKQSLAYYKSPLSSSTGGATSTPSKFASYGAAGTTTPAVSSS